MKRRHEIAGLLTELYQQADAEHAAQRQAEHANWDTMDRYEAQARALLWVLGAKDDSIYPPSMKEMPIPGSRNGPPSE